MNQVANSMEITETANMKALNRSIIFNEKAPAPLEAVLKKLFWYNDN